MSLLFKFFRDLGQQLHQKVGRRVEGPLPDTRTHDLPKPPGRWERRCLEGEKWLLALLRADLLRDRRFYGQILPNLRRHVYQYLKECGHDVTTIPEGRLRRGGGTNDDLAQVTDPAQLRAFIDAVYEGAGEWEARCRAAEDRLLLLCRLKLYKERHGKDAVYQANQPPAWARALEHLKQHRHDVEADPLV